MTIPVLVRALKGTVWGSEGSMIGQGERQQKYVSEEV